MIDTHATFFAIGGPFGLNADLVGVRSGVTTLVDQVPQQHDVCGTATTSSSRRQRRPPFPLMSSVVWKAITEPIARWRQWLPPFASSTRTATLPKAQGARGGWWIARWGFKVIEMAKDISTQSGLPIYIHLGQLWPLPDDPNQEIDPDIVIPEVVKMLGDILRTFAHPGGFVNTKGNLHPSVREALDKGIKVDVERIPFQLRYGEKSPRSRCRSAYARC